MIPARLASLLDRCESLYRAGRYADALTETNAFPELERVEPPVVAMEARLCMMAGEWQRGIKRAYLVEFADGDEYKLAAAEFFAAYAGHLCGTDQIERGKFYVLEATKVFPGVRLQMLEDPALAPIFGGGDP